MKKKKCSRCLFFIISIDFCRKKRELDYDSFSVITQICCRFSRSGPVRPNQCIEGERRNATQKLRPGWNLTQDLFHREAAEQNGAAQMINSFWTNRSKAPDNQILKFYENGTFLSHWHSANMNFVYHLLTVEVAEIRSQMSHRKKTSGMNRI